MSTSELADNFVKTSQFIWGGRKGLQFAKSVPLEEEKEIVGLIEEKLGKSDVFKYCKRYYRWKV